VSRDTQTELIRLLRAERVLEMPALRHAFPGRSKRSIFRDLVAVGYVTSCNLDGRFYALAETPPWDPDGLWRCAQALFSRHGTLKATIRHLVEQAEAGRTHLELQATLHLRVHDTLFDLGREGQIARELVDKLFLYVSADLEVQAAQIARRRTLLEQAGGAPLGPYEIIEILLMVIHRDVRQPEQALARLRAQGRTVDLAQIQEIFKRYDLGKKN